jgi:hypothetical protein
MKKMIINSYTKNSFLSSLFCPVSVLEPKIYLNNKNLHYLTAGIMFLLRLGSKKR